ncbi:type II toxin-antitoxin system YhaV family toxin [Pseudomonas sp. PS02290]|uniref:type II toxin-antitoxin system YhaV family toxin n=1 Tax=Pseudomonas sp. PS02290 TaxID=2991430 RepID=UPI00249C832F|nr:type II toxin-antitoxin system YhaV family toxin [Pseudomonas sp. PS02290]
MSESTIHVENGWALYAHPFFVQRLEELTSEVERALDRDPEGFHHHPSFKLLEAIAQNIFVNVPSNPDSPSFRQGKTLGKTRGYWRRVKKQGMNPRYRLFFQFRSEAPKTIIYVWINDQDSIRKAGSKTDVYSVFAAKLEKGIIPESFADLLAACHPLDKDKWQGGAEE